jgi:NAD(P)-dependent dehydrogenase (short-subunit alcohol dehydrogenase family)
MSSTPARRALVVGASSGIGAALVRQLAREGWKVAALARRGAELETLARECGAIVRTHDVKDFDAVPQLFEELARELGGLELIVYAAGVMPRVGRDEYDTRKDLEMVAVNLGGCIAWCNAATAFFRTQRTGTIVGISSISGERGRKGAPVYGTTKAAMNTYLEALRNRLAESNVHVCTIKPGFVETAMTRELQNPLWIIPADEAARQILAAARARANERFVPRRWWLVATVIRSIPSFLFRHLNV